MNTYNFLFSFFKKCFSPHSLSEFQNNFVGRAVVFYVGDVVRWTFLFIRILEGLLLRGVGWGEESEEDWEGPCAVSRHLSWGSTSIPLLRSEKKKTKKQKNKQQKKNPQQQQCSVGGRGGRLWRRRDIRKKSNWRAGTRFPIWHTVKLRLFLQGTLI